MEEPRELWHLLDIHHISIQSAANVWADRLSRELDDADWQAAQFADIRVLPSFVGRDPYGRRFYGASPPPKFWSVSPLEPSATWTSSTTLTEWLRDAYLAAGAPPPPGFKWTSHSLRKGAASAASCVDVPLPAIKHMSDWSKNNDVVTGKYIDSMTMHPTPAAWRFFGWLVPVRPLD
eukprot:jgi/Tetstr1/435090/TSEL_024058.t1